MSRLRLFWRSTVGKKVVMGASGLIMILFLIFHVAANLLVYGGPTAINGFADFLDARTGLQDHPPSDAVAALDAIGGADGDSVVGRARSVERALYGLSGRPV